MLSASGALESRRYRSDTAAKEIAVFAPTVRTPGTGDPASRLVRVPRFARPTTACTECGRIIMLGVQRMSFRQHNKNPGTSWRKTRRAELLAAGMPDFLIDDERRWNYVLLHGDDELESGWSPSQITREQAADLLRLLQSHHESRVGLDLFRALEKKIDERHLQASPLSRCC